LPGVVQSISLYTSGREEEAARARHPAAASNGNALVLVDVRANEDDLNHDAYYGYPAGTTSAKKAVAKAAQIAVEAKINALVADGTYMTDAYYIAHYGTIPDWVLEARADA